MLPVPPALCILYVLVLIPFTPGISDIRKAKVEQPARVISADGKELASFKRANREWVKLEQISPFVVDALVSTEDHRFYDHHGLDWRRTASAMVHTFSGNRQGGSTITQQLARNLYPEEIGRAPTLTRKIKEAITAVKIELVYSKKEILETYLNTVPFLFNAYGIEMAARTYFDVSADELTLPQSATLIGMLKGNSYYNPVLNPERAQQRRNTVLAQMVKHKKLDPAKFALLKKKKLQIDFERQAEALGAAPHFSQQLRKWLVEWADRNGYNIYADGLTVHTTIDSRLQNMANLAVARQGNYLQTIANGAWGNPSSWGGNKELAKALVRESTEYHDLQDAGVADKDALKQLFANANFIRKLHQQKTRVQLGFLAIDPRNGQIKAWVGSRDFSQDGFDHVQQARRQPGSTFKPFVYGTAFLQGKKPEDTYVDKEVEIKLRGGEIWRPSDGTPPSDEAMSLRDGLAYSKNTITAQLMQSVGPAEVVKFARAMGVRQSKLEANPALALGTSPVSLKEMVTAYGTIANGGDYIEPIFVTRIEDRNGRVLEKFAESEPETMLPHKVAYTLLDVMRGVIDRGTGAGIRSQFGIRADVAGKTGTTQNNTDGWFILMHPQLVAGAWAGFNDNRLTLRSNYWGQGAHSALPVVGEVFQQSIQTHLLDTKLRFTEKPDTGLLPNMSKQVGNWFSSLFAPTPPVATPKPRRAPTLPESAPAQETPVESTETKEEAVVEDGNEEEVEVEEVVSAPNSPQPAQEASPEKPGGVLGGASNSRP